MARIFSIVICLLIWGNHVLGNINISLTSPAPQTLIFTYSANSAYDAAPNNIWNSQVLTLRWSTLLGANVITAIQNQAAFVFTLDGSPVDGNDGFFLSKIHLSCIQCGAKYI